MWFFWCSYHKLFLIIKHPFPNHLKKRMWNKKIGMFFQKLEKLVKFTLKIQKNSKFFSEKTVNFVEN
jgi:hypothetical protein